MTEDTLYLDWARDVLNMEVEGLHEIAAALDHDFVRAVEALLHYKGRVVITGMGKSGHISRKMAATMTSTGAPVFFVHPAEVAHGDLGVIVDHDVVIAIPSPGESDEIAAIIPALKRKNIMFICITAHPISTTARHAGIHITAVVSKETCPLGLMPTSSAATAMTLGDALVVVLLRARAFALDDFALSHPTGSSGKRPLLRVAGIMRRDEALPAALLDMPSREAIVRMDEKGLGVLAVTDVEGYLKGAFTGGDLCRLFRKCDSFAGLKTDDIMCVSPKTILAGRPAAEALKIIQNGHVNGLLAVEENGVLIGALNVHDLSVARIVWIDGKNTFRWPYARIGRLK